MSGEAAHGVFGESVEDQRRVDRFQEIGEACRSNPARMRHRPGSGGFSCCVGDGGLGRGGFFGRRLVERVDLEHVGDRSDAGDGFFGEFADTEGQGSREFSVEIDRAAAHSGDYSGIFDFLLRAGGSG